MTFDETETDGLAGSRYWPKMGCDANGPWPQMQSQERSVEVRTCQNLVQGITVPWVAAVARDRDVCCPQLICSDQC